MQNGDAYIRYIEMTNGGTQTPYTPTEQPTMASKVMNSRARVGRSRYGGNKDDQADNLIADSLDKQELAYPAHTYDVRYRHHYVDGAHNPERAMAALDTDVYGHMMHKRAVGDGLHPYMAATPVDAMHANSQMRGNQPARMADGAKSSSTPIHPMHGYNYYA